MKYLMMVILFVIVGCTDNTYEDNDVCAVLNITKCNYSFCEGKKAKYIYELSCNKRGGVTYYTSKEYKLDDLILFESSVYYKEGKR